MDAIRSGIILQNPQTDTIVSIGSINGINMTGAQLAASMPMFFQMETPTLGGNVMLCMVRVDGEDPAIVCNDGVLNYTPKYSNFVGGRPNDR
jgi:hypothetical protein